MENRVYILTALVLSSFGAFGQNHKAAKAEKHYDAYSFAEAIEVYEGMEEKDVHSVRKLADSYFKVGKYVQAEEVYQTLVASEDRTSEDVLNYSSVLRINKKYEEAERLFQEGQYNGFPFL